MRATCPDCGAQGHVSAFFADDDGKRFAVQLAGMQPDLGRAVIAYLGLFKPVKTALRMARAVKLVQELIALVDTGDVCKDERNGVRRPASPGTWAAGIETMLVQRAALTLPLENHNYLRAVVFGLADKADAANERQKETNARAGKHLNTASGKSASTGEESRLVAQLQWINDMVAKDQFTEEEAEAERAKAHKAHEKYGSKP